MVPTRRPRLSLTLRLILLLPVLATGVDVTRATLACGPDAETCLAAAGRGWMGTVAVALVPLYASLFGVLLARAARTRGRAPEDPPPSFARLWLLGSAAMGAVTAGQMLLARGLDGGASLGGTPLGIVALCLAAGAIVALAMRALHAARELRPRAPRVRLVELLPAALVAPPVLTTPQPLAAPARGRGPPRS